MFIKPIPACLILVSLLFVILLTMCAERQKQFYEDQISHAVKEKDIPGGTERVIFKPDNFDAARAVWEKGVSLGISSTISDGDIILFKISHELYAVKIKNQKTNPEIVTYDYWKLSDSQKISQMSGSTIDIDGTDVDWSCARTGEGVIYMDPFFLKDVPPRFEVGVPFFKGQNGSDLNEKSKSIQFESLPWKI